jgi:hypothetical protein
MPNKKDPITRTDDKPQSRKELEEKRYDISGPFGRIMLVRDAEGLSAREKSYLTVLATTCGGKGVGHDPALTFIGDHEVAAGSATSLSVVKAARKGLMHEDCLIVTGHWQRNEYTWFTSVDWLKLREYSYKWRAMLRKEAQNDARPPAAVRPPAATTAEEQAVLDDLDSQPQPEKPSAMTVKDSTNNPEPSISVAASVDDMSDLDNDAPQSSVAAQPQVNRQPFTFEMDEPVAPEDDCASSSSETTEDAPLLTLSYRGHVLLQALIEITRRSGSAFSGDYDRLTEDDEETIVEVCEKWGIEVAMTSRGYLLTLPLHECAALRLTHASGKYVAPSNCKGLAGKESDDHYSVIEYGLATESWATIIRKADYPIAMLMKHFSAIQESWIEHGSPICEPPASEAVHYIAGPHDGQPNARSTWTLEERFELFKARRALDIHDDNVISQTTDDSGPYETTSGWESVDCELIFRTTNDDDWVDRIEAALVKACVAGDATDPVTTPVACEDAAKRQTLMRGEVVTELIA